MLINVTREFLNKLKMLYNLASGNNNLPHIKWDTANVLTAIGKIYNLSYKLGQEETGLIEEHPEKTFLLSREAAKFILSRHIGETLNIEVKGNNINVSINGKKINSSFLTVNSEAFPDIKDPDKLNVFAINGASFNQAIKLTNYAISNNNAKPIYTGLHFIAENGKLTIFSCDGYRAARVALPYQSEKNFTISVPRETINFLNTVTFGDAVNLSVDDGFLKAIIKLDDGTTLRTPLLSGEIIDHKSLFVKMKNKIVVNKAVFSEILKNVLLLQDSKLTQVKFTFSGNKGYVFLHTNFTTFNDEFEAKSSAPDEEFTIAFNPIYLKEAIDNIPEKEDGTITLHYTGSLSPIKINNGINDIQALVVPMRLPTNNTND